MVSLLLLLFLLAVPVASDTTFIFSGTLLCNLTDPYSVELNAVEHDEWTYNEDLHTEQFKDVIGPITYNFTTSDTDDGWLDNFFELQFLINHSCNTEFLREKLAFYIDIAEIPVDGGVHLINVPDIDLTDRGEKIKLWQTVSA